MNHQQQQAGGRVQRQAQGFRSRKVGAAPDIAVTDREVQDHELADRQAAPGADPGPGRYPASRLADSPDDGPPRAPAVDWNHVVQPERRPDARAQPEQGDDEEERLRRHQAARQEGADRYVPEPGTPGQQEG